MNDCCGFLSCYYVADSSYCDNVNSPARLFRKVADAANVGVDADGVAHALPIAP